MDIVAIQETRWPLAGKINTKDYIIYYSGSTDGRYYGGVGFAIRKTWASAVITFNSFNERMCNIRIKGRFRNMSLVSIYAPTEDADEEDKDIFYDSLEELTTQLPKYDLRIVLGDANAKIGKESLWDKVAGKHSLHEVTNENGLRLLSFSEVMNLKVVSTMFPHKNIHKETWVAPNGLVKNQIDHALVDQRHKSSILDVHSLRGAECGSDHYLILVKVKQRIAVEKKKNGSQQERWEIGKLKKKEVVDEFRLKLENRFQVLEDIGNTVEDNWKTFKTIIQETTKEVCGKAKRPRKKPWFDDECQLKIKERKTFKEIWLGNPSDENKRNYSNSCREMTRLFRRKKRQYINSLLEKAQNESDKNPRSFYKTIKLFTGGYTPISYGVKKNDEIVIEKSKVLDIWKDYFQDLLNGEEDTEGFSSPTYLNVQPNIEDPTVEEIQEIIKTMKNNKAPGEDGICAEILKAGGIELAKKLHKIILQVWEREDIPEDWRNAIIIPIHKKGDKRDPNNYRGISLLSTSYKVLSKVLQKRLEKYTEEIIEEHQAGFQRGRSTIDQIYILKEAIAKYWEFGKSFYGLFIDFSKAYDSIYREKIWHKMESFGIPKKLIKLATLSVNDSKSKVKIENEYSSSFDIKTGVRQGDIISPTLFNIALEGALKELKKTDYGIKIGNKISALAFADDVVLLSETREELQKMLEILKRETRTMGLKINDNKTKLVRFGRGTENEEDITEIEQQYEQVETFKYLGVIVSSQSEEHIEIKNRINLASRSLHALNKLLSTRLLSHRTKLKIYKTIIRPVLLYGAETWTLDKNTEKKLITFENKVLRKIFGPTKEGDTWRIKHNHELRDLFKEPDIIAEAKSRRLRWAGHIIRREETKTIQQVWECDPLGRRPRGRPKKRWKDEVKKDMARMGVNEDTARERTTWRRCVGEAKYHLGYKWPWE